MECSNPECKQEFKLAMKGLMDDLYGEGPDGDGGVYGVLKKKVSWRALIFLMSPLLGVIGYFIGFAMIHESRLTKAETIIQRNTEIIYRSERDINMIREENRQIGEKILKAIQQLGTVK